MRTIGVNETCITILEDIYTGAAARVHMDNQVWNTNTEECEAWQPNVPQIIYSNKLAGL